MRKLVMAMIALMFAIGIASVGFAAESADQGASGAVPSALMTPPMPDMGTGGDGTAMEMPAPSIDAVKVAIDNYIKAKSEEGTLPIEDTGTGSVRKLTLATVQDKVGKTETSYFACAIFKDTTTGDSVDLDFDLADQGGIVLVINVQIHKVNDHERYSYDANNNRVPAGAGAAAGAGSSIMNAPKTEESK